MELCFKVKDGRSRNPCRTFILSEDYLCGLAALTTDKDTVGRVGNAYALEVVVFYGGVRVVDNHTVDTCGDELISAKVAGALNREVAAVVCGG